MTAHIGASTGIELRRFDLELILGLCRDELHAILLYSGVDIVALVGSVVHGVLGEVVDAGSPLLLDEKVELTAILIIALWTVPIIECIAASTA